jgi:hypothetical protein
MDTSVADSGVTVTVAAAWLTVTVALPEAPLLVAVIVAAPFPAAVTTPFVLTVAQFSSDELQTKVWSGIVLPLSSRAVAERVAVSPSEARAAVAGVTDTEATAGPVASPPHANAETTTKTHKRFVRRDLQEFADSNTADFETERMHTSWSKALPSMDRGLVVGQASTTASGCDVLGGRLLRRLLRLLRRRGRMGHRRVASVLVPNVQAQKLWVIRKSV